VEPDLPTVFFSETPAVVVNIDEDPIWSPIAGMMADHRPCPTETSS